jgi:hypothetical protein
MVTQGIGLGDHTSKISRRKVLNMFKTLHRPPATTSRSRSCIVVPLVVRWELDAPPIVKDRVCNYRSIDLKTGRLIVLPIVKPHNQWCNYLRVKQTGCTTLLVGVVAADLHLVVRLVADSPHKWHD